MSFNKTGDWYIFFVEEKQNTLSAVNPEGVHPLTNENDVYDNANSLQVNIKKIIKHC